MSLASIILILFFFTFLSHALPYSASPRAINEMVTSSLFVPDHSIGLQDVTVTTIFYSLYTGSGQQ